MNTRTVPVEPTEIMIDAGAREGVDAYHNMVHWVHIARRIYDAMLLVAPKEREPMNAAPQPEPADHLSDPDSRERGKGADKIWADNARERRVAPRRIHLLASYGNPPVRRISPYDRRQNNAAATQVPIIERNGDGKNVPSLNPASAAAPASTLPVEEILRVNSDASIITYRGVGYYKAPQPVNAAAPSTLPLSSEHKLLAGMNLLSEKEIDFWQGFLQELGETHATPPGCNVLCRMALAAIEFEKDMQGMIANAIVYRRRIHELEHQVAEKDAEKDREPLRIALRACHMELAEIDTELDDAGIPSDDHSTGKALSSCERVNLLAYYREQAAEEAESELASHQQALLFVRTALGLHRDSENDLLEVIRKMRAELTELRKGKS